MKRTCNRCRAQSGAWRGMACSLGYKTKSDYNTELCISVNFRPAEECPKPLTTLKYYELKYSDKERANGNKE